MSNAPRALRLVLPADAGDAAPGALDDAAVAHATKTLAEIKLRGAAAVLEYAVQFGELAAGAPAVVLPAAMKAAFDGLPDVERQCLVNVGTRIRAFAAAQRASITELTTKIPGGEAGHTLAAVTVAGCYAPGGRYPLPSSVLMTAITARAAGCKTVVVATPKPLAVTLAAAHVAGADFLLAVGGAHAICVLATGALPGVPKCDVICGPGSKWVTAAKSVVSSSCNVGIDMLAGPSEVLVVCDATADVATVAADLLAQAEHDARGPRLRGQTKPWFPNRGAVVARPILVAFGPDMAAATAVIDAVDAEVVKQLAVLPTAGVAAPAVKAGFAVACVGVDEAIAVSDAVSPEHLEIMCADAEAVSKRCKHYGGLFVGSHAAEVLGDYGIGPNHTLPTGGTARYTGGLSIFAFLRIRTWMRVDDLAAAQPAVEDAVTLARIEGLEGHARAAEHRLAGATSKKRKA
ncbi:histidinol dehydrogenase [Pelagophyceae sp. CCMP2097]|nr:histidinol dehydrogenase [Pelagophyceae sp. CCMP2097]